MSSSPVTVDEVKLLGINLSTKPRWAQLVICGGGFFFGYLVNGLVEVGGGLQVEQVPHEHMLRNPFSRLCGATF